MRWEDKREVKKGNYGEKIVADYFRSNGYMSYKPEFEGAHPFDKFVAKRDKRKIFIAEVKTKARRNQYPDTGVDVRHYKEYMFIQDKYNVDVFVYFVDEFLKEIYGGCLRTISQPTKLRYRYKKQKHSNWKQKDLHYPFEGRSKKIYFPLVHLKTISEIPDKLALKMQKLSNRSYEFKLPYKEEVEILRIESGQYIFDTLA